MSPAGPLQVFEFVDVRLLDAVARIACIASDVVISVQPALGTDSSFSKHLSAFAEANATATTLKSQPSSSEVQLMLDTSTVILILIIFPWPDTFCQVQCRSPPFCFRPVTLREIGVGYDGYCHITAIPTISPSACTTSCRHSSVFAVC